MENEMNNSVYKKHLIEQLEAKRLLAASQVGKSNLEDINYLNNIEKWYSQIYNAVDNHPPIFYVREITIYQSEDRKINGISYYYYVDDEIGNVSLCILTD